MAGNTGSPLCAELNRIANYGVYPDRDDFLEEQGAANVWAGTSGLGLLGALNYIVDPNRTDNNYKGLTAVCNELAGTTGLSDVDALRTIGHPAEVLLKGTTARSASYYVDAATPRYNYPGYISLNRDLFQYMSVPDATNLRLTGDVNVVVQIAPDSWTPAANQILVSKFGIAGSRSWWFSIDALGAPQFVWSADGTNFTTITSSTYFTFAPGTIKWLQVIFDSNNGASGNDVKFYTSDDGVTWTQFGSTITTASVATIFSSSAQVEIGARTLGGSTFAGKFYRAQIFASLNDTDKRLDADLTTNVTSATFNQFTATTGQLVTINGQDVLTNGGTAGSLLPTTVGSSLAADSNDAKFLDHTGTNYVYLPGVANNYISVPDAAPLDITGDIDIRWYGALDDWTPAATNMLVTKYDAQISYYLQLSTNGRVRFGWSENGSTAINADSDTASPFIDGQAGWIRATLDVDNGAAGNTTTFYTSTNGTTWTQLGSTVVKAGTTSIFNSTTNINIGGFSNGSTLPTTGKVFRAQILNGINGTTVLDVDTSVITSGADTYVAPTTYTGQAGAYFTGTGLSLNGVAGNYVSTPDATPLDITGDLDIQCKVALTDWTPTQANSIIGKYLNTGNQRSYELEVGTDGKLTLAWSTNGTTPTSKASTVAPTVANGATLWIRVTLDVDNGASGNDVRFFTSDDGVTWTQLGDTVTTAGTTSIFSSSAPLEVGSVFAGTTQPTQGTIYRTIVKNGINGTTAFDANFETVSANALRMTESSTNRAVVTLSTTRYATINRSTSGRKSVAVTQPTWLFGTDDYMEVNNRYMAHSTAAENYVYLSGASGNYMSVADNPPLDVTGDIDIQCKVALDDWTPAANQALIAKRNTNTAYQFFVLATTGTIGFIYSVDGTNLLQALSSVAPTVADGGTLWVRATRVASTGLTKFFTSNDGTNWTQLGTDIESTPGNIFSSADAVEIGSRSLGTSIPAKGKFFRSIIKNGIDGPVVLDADASVITLPSQTTFVDRSSNAYTVTINKSGVGTFVSTGNYMYLPGIAGCNAAAPDSAALDITGDIDLRVKVAMDDWTPAATQYLIAKFVGGSNNRSYALRVNTDGTLMLNWSANGTTQLNAQSTVATGLADGATKWVRLTFDVDNGAAGNTATFFLSDDGLTWTQLGSPVVTAGTTSLFNSTATLEIGSINDNVVSNARGKFFRAQVLNGINGTVAFDANFENSITSLLQTTFTESSTNGATVTINRSGSTYRSAGVIDAGYLYPGATNTFTNSTTDFLNMSANQSFTVFGAFRQWATQSNGRIVDKRVSSAYSSGQVGYSLNNDTAISVTAFLGDGTDISFGPYYKPILIGSIAVYLLSVDRSTNKATAYYNNSPSTTGDIPLIGDLTNVFPLSIGRWGGQASSYADMEFMGAAVFRTALTTKNLADITNYFNGRD